jgi:sec-independent protein translocase protein TatA
MFGLSLTELLVILAIVLLLFGTKKLKNLGTDLGGAIKGFRSAMTEEEEADAEREAGKSPFIEGESRREARQERQSRPEETTTGEHNR